MKKICQKIKEADAVLIGASNGFSITEGIHLFADNQDFENLFGDFKRKYGVRNILQGLAGRWPSEEEKWGFHSRLINHYSGSYTGSKVMSDLKKLLRDKPYFIVTSNGEGHFELAGFDKEKIYEIEGNWLNMQCERHCHDTLYPSMDLIKQMAVEEKDGKIPEDMIPHCPKCGAGMYIHVPIDENFIPNNEQEERYKYFLQEYHGKKLVVLELGIGWRNQLIKAPFMKLVEREPNATYITVNKGEIYIPDAIAEKSVGVDGLIGTILEELCGGMK